MRQRAPMRVRELLQFGSRGRSPSTGSPDRLPHPGRASVLASCLCQAVGGATRALGWRPVMAAILMVCVLSARGQGFVPAFGADDLDDAHCRGYRDGVATSAPPAAVRLALGLHAPDANGEAHPWIGGTAVEGRTTRFDYVVVLKRPVAVGSLCVDVADEQYRGSRNQGELWYLKPDAPVPPSPDKPEQWVPVVFPPAQPVTRFATLPPGVQTRAFLYRDVRVAGVSRVDHWRLFQTRLFNATPLARAAASGGFKSDDADAIPRGRGWGTAVGAAGGKISAKDPAWVVLAWDAPRRVDGLFLRSNATDFNLEYLPAATEAATPALAPDSAWRALAATGRMDLRHDYRYWACAYHWLSVAPTEARAVRLKLTAVERGGDSVWLNGLALFTDLLQSPVPVVAAADEGAPFRFQYDVPLDGQMALVLEDAQGHRLKNILAQVDRPAGPATESWDLKDGTGAYVAPGTYRLRGIVGPPPELRYGITPYPNVDQLWPDRTPWMQGHSGPHGWLSDHSQNWAVASVGDRLYFGASMAEAGVCLIECDLDGKKLWGKHDFNAWLGVGQMAGDDKYLYVAASDNTLYRLDPATHETTRLGPVFSGPERRGSFSCLAAHGGRVYLGFTGEQYLDNAFHAGQVDMANCLPKPASDDFLRALRVMGHPPGQVQNPNDADPKGNGTIDLESTVGAGAVQYLLIAFKEPVPIGSVVFPHPGGPAAVAFSVLKPDAPYPPRLKEETDWTAFADQGRPAAWNCLPAPPATLTRALRIAFTRDDKQRLEQDDVTDLLEDAALGDAPEVAAERRTAAASHLGKGDWYGRIEGLRVLRRRYSTPAASAQLRVNSGTVAANGAWDAQRREALGPEKPGVYVLEWPASQKLVGLALKEVDGAVTEIDVWQGPVEGALPLEGVALDAKSRATGWRQVATYRQPRRSAYHPSPDCNKFARYLDGLVDFHEEIETRGVRLRVTQPWFDHGEKNAECRKHDGRSEHGVHYTQSYASELDTRLCGVLGVAPLRYERGEPPLDRLVYQRVDVRDGQTGALLRELPAEVGWHGLACGPDGALYAIERTHQDIVRLDRETGAATPVVRGCNPHTMTVGPDGSFYVRSWEENGSRPIQVYAADGRPVRTVGQGGGRQAGPWVPARFHELHRLCVDRQGSLWALESQNYPRRIVQYDRAGALVKELFGNTFYGGGGGGNLNRYDAGRAWYGAVEFELDWQKHTSRVSGLLATDLGGDLVAVRLKGRSETYLATTPNSLEPRQSHAVVYLYDAARGTTRRVAAVGSAEFFEPLRASRIVTLLEGAVPQDFAFRWSDRNGNGEVDADEVQFEPRPKGFNGVGRVDYDLGFVGPGVHYRVKEVLANGVPVYERLAVAGAPHLKLTDGSFFTLGGQPAADAGSANFVTGADGALRWSYPAGAGMSGLFIPSWSPGQVNNQFAVIGHEVAPKGDLGEFLVVHANTGEWNLWTADGLLAGQVLLHKGNSLAHLFGPAEARPGMRLDPLSASQEHFHGFFTRTEPDNRYFIVAGFTHMSIVEVQGLERFRRFQSEVQVTPADLARVKAWDASRVQRQVESRALVATARLAANAPLIDGDGAPHEWPAPVSLDADDRARFGLSYDNTHLYLCWMVKGLGPLANSGEEFQRLFKTGAALDFRLGTDPAADPRRTQPARGDLRLLVTFVAGKPRVVLYQPVLPGAPAATRWSTRTEAGGETAFDRVAELTDARVALRGQEDFTVEVVVPLTSLGLVPPRGGESLKMDWGLLVSRDGHQVQQRLYWADKTATGTSDEAVEARLNPALWGNLRFEAGVLEEEL